LFVRIFGRVIVLVGWE